MKLSNYILIAEDDADDQALVKDALIDVSVPPEKIRFVNNGSELIASLRQARQLPNIIFMDLNMPIKDGFEALSEIRADKLLKLIPVIVFSTSADIKSVEKSYILGSNAYMVKPNTYTQLVKSMAATLSFWLEEAKIVNA